MAKEKSFASIEQKCEKELEWYFHMSDADMGIKSNWSAIINDATTSKSARNKTKSSVIDYYSNKQMIAVSRKREIDRAFYALTPLHQRSLFAMVGWIPTSLLPPDIRHALGRYAPLVICAHPSVLKEQITNKDTKHKEQTNKHNISLWEIDANHKSLHIKWIEEARITYRDAITQFNSKRNNNAI